MWWQAGSRQGGREEGRAAWQLACEVEAEPTPTAAEWRAPVSSSAMRALPACMGPQPGHVGLQPLLGGVAGSASAAVRGSPSVARSCTACEMAEPSAISICCSEM